MRKSTLFTVFVVLVLGGCAGTEPVGRPAQPTVLRCPPAHVARSCTAFSSGSRRRPSCVSSSMRRDRPRSTRPWTPRPCRGRATAAPTRRRQRVHVACERPTALRPLLLQRKRAQMHQPVPGDQLPARHRPRQHAVRPPPHRGRLRPISPPHLSHPGRGGRIQLAVPMVDDCGVCNATGAAPGAKLQACAECGGSGTVTSSTTRPGRPLIIIVYAATILGGDLCHDDECLEAGLFAPDDIPWDDLAFPSTRDALRAYLQRRSPRSPNRF